jgi:glycosyltransferase involved in cell wall biosynthesis
MPTRFGFSPSVGLARKYASRLKRRIGLAHDHEGFPLRHLPTLNEVLSEFGVEPIVPVSHPIRSEVDAIRYLVFRAARRWGTPPALSQGPTGSFYHRAIRGLDEKSISLIRQVLENQPGRGVERVYEFRYDLRQIWPLALTPAQRGDYLRWLLTHGRDAFSLSPEAVLWYLFTLDEDPSCGLATTFRLQPAWQSAVPDGLTRFGWHQLKIWIAQTYQVQGRWLRHARLPPQYQPWDELKIDWHIKKRQCLSLPASEVDIPRWVKSHVSIPVDRQWVRQLQTNIRDGLPSQLGVNVMGLFRYTSGLQQAARSCVAALQSAGVRCALRDVPVEFHREPRDKTRYDALEQFDTTLLCTGIDTSVERAYHECGWYQRPGVYRIAMWWWEMESLPSHWHDRAAGIDEIWGPTRFIADAMRKAYPQTTVVTMLPGLSLPAYRPRPRSYFGLSDERTIFGFVFDMNSRMQRKNPLGLIQAFRKAFQRSEPVDLVLKVSPPERFYAREWNELRAAAHDAGVIILDRMLSRSELLALIDCFDCYVSLHRSEGLGLTCAEAMWLGKPTIATGYSGNLDFMTSQTSYLVDYDRVTLTEDYDPYFRGGVWAEPSVTHAAELMRQVFEHPDCARDTGQRAQKHVRECLSLEASGQRMLHRLKEIERLRCVG